MILIPECVPPPPPLSTADKISWVCLGAAAVLLAAMLAL